MYQAPPFDQPPLATAPAAVLAPVSTPGVPPPGTFCTTPHPTYVRHLDGWHLTARARMDAHLVLQSDGSGFACTEMRHLRPGDAVVVATAEDGSQGVLTWTAGFAPPTAVPGFSFMTAAVSRERPAPYPQLVNLLKDHRRHGFIIWVLGPAVVHAGARSAVVRLVDAGFVHAVLSGNALAVHDVEMALHGAALGVGANAETPGHASHLGAIVAVRQAGSLATMVNNGALRGGIMHALVQRQVPFVLAGSIRDDGPLPETVTDALEAQDRMRVLCQKATLVIMVASALHGIAAGNMLPTFHVNADGSVHALPFVCVDQDEWVHARLRDRGTHHALAFVTNAQDFLSRMGDLLADRPQT